jgi:hypothetical protein
MHTRFWLGSLKGRMSLLGRCRHMLEDDVNPLTSMNIAVLAAWSRNAPIQCPV